MGGGESWSKNGGKCGMGGLTKFSPDGGPPLSPGKKPCCKLESADVLHFFSFDDMLPVTF